MTGVRGSDPGGSLWRKQCGFLEFEHLDLRPDPAAHKLCVLWLGLSEPQFVHMQHCANSTSFAENVWGQVPEMMHVQPLAPCWAQKRIR